MSGYIEKLHSLKLFALKDVASLTGATRSAQELLRRYMQRGLVVQIRRNLYTVTDLATKATMASPFEIGSRISKSSYISYHSALEYHGIAHQQYFTLYVSSESRFSDFDFGDIHYIYCKSNVPEGVEIPPMNSKVKVTNLERTIVDCLDRIDRSGGLEELVRSLSMLTFLNEDAFSGYLDACNKAFLYKKAGFVLSYFQNDLKLSDDFIDYCHKKGSANVKYLTDKQESDRFHKKWNIYAPKNILSFLEQGNNEPV